MAEEVSIETLTRMVRRVVREELDRKDNHVEQAVLKLVLDSKGIGMEKEPHEKRVITAGKG
jgi:hypothetical protein